MTVQIKAELGWEKNEREKSSKLGIVGNKSVPVRPESISIISAYDILEQAGSSETNAYITRTVDALLIRRTQMLQ